MASLCRPFAPDNTDARVVEHINAEMRRRLGFDVWTLKCAAQSGSDEHRWRVFNAVARERSPAAPPSAEWLEQGRALSAEFAEPLMREAVIAWFDDYGKPSDDRAPWQVHGLARRSRELDSRSTRGARHRRQPAHNPAASVGLVLHDACAHELR